MRTLAAFLLVLAFPLLAAEPLPATAKADIDRAVAEALARSAVPSASIAW